ncbi:MAG: transporter substrate-binding domain-containing protein [Lachnoclostridium sp.]
MILQSGVSAGIWSESYVVEAINQLGIEVDTISIENEEDIQSSQAWFLYGANEEELKAEIDPILQEIIDDGTLSELSIKWFGDDYTK